MPPAESDPETLVTERPHTHAIDRAANGIEVRITIIKQTINLCYVCCGDLLQTTFKWTCLNFVTVYFRPK
jgi:hypothetical protein